MNNNHTRKLFSNFFALSIIQGTNLLIPLLIMPFIISRIGIASFGVVSVAQVTMIYLSTIGDYGFNFTATRDIALNKEIANNEKTSRIFFTVLTSKLVITIVLFLLLLILISIIPFFKINSKFYLTGFTYVIGQSLLVSWFFLGIEKMKFITFSVLLARIIFAVLALVFINQKDDAYLFLFFLGIGNIIAGFFSIYFAINFFKLKFLSPFLSDIIHELRNGWHFMISNLAGNVYVYINIFILRIFASDLIVGYYSIAEKIFFVIRQLLGVFSQAIYPHICQLTTKGKTQMINFFKTIYLPFLVLICIGTSIMFVLSPQITQLFAGQDSSLSGELLRVFCPALLVICLNIPANLLLLSFNQKKSYLLVSVLATIVNLGANFLLAGTWGATGTVVAIILTEVVVVTGLYFELYKKGLFDYIRVRTV